MLDAIVEMQQDLAESKAAMGELMVLLRHHQPLSPMELADMTSMLDSLSSLATSRHGEIVAKLSSIEAAVHMRRDVTCFIYSCTHEVVCVVVQDVKDIVLQIAQCVGDLTADEVRIRESALKELRVSADSIEVDVEAVIGHGGFGVVYEGRYCDMPVAVKIISFKRHSVQQQKELQRVSTALLVLSLIVVMS